MNLRVRTCMCIYAHTNISRLFDSRQVLCFTNRKPPIYIHTPIYMYILIYMYTYNIYIYKCIHVYVAMCI